MQKLARTENPVNRPAPMFVWFHVCFARTRSDLFASMRPNIPEAKTRNVALKNMFDPAEYVDFEICLEDISLNLTSPNYVCRETEQDWDTVLADDVKDECSEKYGPVTAIKVIKESQVGIHFGTIGCPY